MVLRETFKRRTIVAGGRNARPSITYEAGQEVPAKLVEKLPIEITSLEETAPPPQPTPKTAVAEIEDDDPGPEIPKSEDLLVITEESIFGKKDKTPDVYVPETREEIIDLERDDLKKLADHLGVKYPSNVRLITLRNKVLLKLNLK